MPSAMGALYGFYTKANMRPLKAEEEAAFSLDIYLKQEPDLMTYLPGIAKIIQESAFNGTKEYSIHPARAEEPWFRVLTQKEASHPSLQITCFTTHDPEDDISDIVEDATNEHIDVPVRFLEKLSDQGMLTGNEELFHEVQTSPCIRQLFSEYAAFWEILRFTEGKPAYTMTAEITGTSINHRGLPYYLSFVRQFCRRYEGIVCDEERDHYGIPTLRRLRLQGEREKRIIASLGWEWPARD